MLGRHLVPSVAFARPVVAVAGRQRRLRLAYGAAVVGRLVGVRVVSGGVGVDGFARDHHRRRRLVRERQQQCRIGGREADAVDEQVRTCAERCAERVAVVAVRADEAAACRGNVGRHVGRVATGEIDIPAVGEQPPRDGAPDQAGSPDDERAAHAA